MIQIKNVVGDVIKEVEGDTLVNANLSNINLTWAYLSYKDLRRVNLEGSNLSDANLVGANLSNAILCLADLTNTSLFGADLRGADFRYCRGVICHQINGLEDPLIFTKYGENLTESMLQIRNDTFDLKYWLEHYQDFMEVYEYSESEIKEYYKYMSFLNELYK